MRSLVRKLASLRLTLVGMALLAVLALIGTRHPGVDVSVTALPIALLCLNLLAAIATNRCFRTQAGLLVFHVGLLLVFASIGLTVLTRFDGHAEVVQGAGFDARTVQSKAVGWLHRNALDTVEFTQGDIRVAYLPNLVRQDTRSTLEYRDAGVVHARTIGDRVGAEFAGYRFLATFNKGFAIVLRWTGADGAVGLGSVHFPSFPQHDWQQVAEWITPAGQALELELDFDAPVFEAGDAWVLQDTSMPFTLRLRGDGLLETAAREGASVAVQGGEVRVEDLRLWMAYRIDYLPFLPWMFVAAMFAIIGLAMHFASRYLPQHAAQANDGEEAEGAHVARV